MMAMLRSLLLLFMMFFMGSAEVNLAERCPCGWTGFGHHCYKYFPQLVNWVTAERNCQSHGANLASVHNKPENDFLLSLVPAPERCWVGAHDGEQEGQWLWTDGSPVDFIHWCPTEPNNSGGSENCVEINWTSNRCWNDQSCLTGMSSICAIAL